MNSSVFNTVPDARARLMDIIHNISQHGPEKFGTENVFRSHPELLDPIKQDLEALNTAFGSNYFSKERIGLLLTIITFYAAASPSQASRTDFHAEPIANLVVQLEGRKRWTLATADQWRLFRPQASPDGRAYIYSTLTPEHEQFQKIKRYEVVLEKGDLLFLPPWTWHRVDYLQGEPALGVSFFHVRPFEMLTSNPVFTTLIVPNMIKELIGWKTQ